MFDIEKQKIKWEKQKSKGKIKFILVNGVLIYGSLSILAATFHIFVIKRTLLNSIQDIVLIYLMYIIGWSLVGIASGNMSWKNNIKKFEK